MTLNYENAGPGAEGSGAPHNAAGAVAERIEEEAEARDRQLLEAGRAGEFDVTVSGVLGSWKIRDVLEKNFHLIDAFEQAEAAPFSPAGDAVDHAQSLRLAQFHRAVAEIRLRLAKRARFVLCGTGRKQASHEICKSTTNACELCYNPDAIRKDTRAAKPKRARQLRTWRSGLSCIFFFFRPFRLCLSSFSLRDEHE